MRALIAMGRKKFPAVYKRAKGALKTFFIYSWVKKGQFQSADWDGIHITETRWDPYVRQILFSDMQRWKDQKAIYQRLIRSEHPVVFDVGANIGFVSLLLSKIKRATIYSFEPASLAYACLKKNVEQNDVPMIHPFHLGFSDKEQSLFIGPPTGTQHERYKRGNKKTGLYSVHASPTGHDAAAFGEMATFTTMDTFCEKNAVRKLDYVKIDVEGHEINVLQGGIHTLMTFKPICQVEFHPVPMAIAHREPQELFNFFDQIEYVVTTWNKNGFKLTTIQDLKKNGTWIVTELYCFPKNEPVG